MLVMLTTPERKSRCRMLPSEKSGISTSRPGSGSPSYSAAIWVNTRKSPLLCFRPAPTAAVRQQAAARLDRLLDKAAQNLQSVPEQEFEAAVEEATQQVRQWKT
jgi:hypothetical protein